MKTRNQVIELLVKNNQFGINSVMSAKGVKESLGIDQKELNDLVNNKILRIRPELKGKRWYVLY